MKNISLALTALLLTATLAHAWPARVVSVADGDTITVEPVNGGERVKVRLHGVDAPERKQPYGETSRIFVTDMVRYKVVDVQPEGKPDRYGRTVAKVVLKDGRMLQALLVETGMAWVYEQYCKKKDPDCRRWRGLQRQAQNRGLGLWVEDDAVAPWEWRKARRGKK